MKARLLCSAFVCSFLCIASLHADPPPDLASEIEQAKTAIATVAAKPASAVGDKQSLRTLNNLKIQLITLLTQEIAQLNKDSSTQGLSSSAQAAIKNMSASDQTEVEALNDSLGSWTSPIETSGATAHPATPATEAPAASGPSKPVTSGGAPGKPRSTAHRATLAPAVATTPAAPDPPAPTTPPAETATAPPPAPAADPQGPVAFSRAPANHTNDQPPAATCGNPADSTEPIPVLSAIDIDADKITGKVKVEETGATIQVCIDEGSADKPSYKAVGKPASVGQDGTFTVSLVDASAKQPVQSTLPNANQKATKSAQNTAPKATQKPVQNTPLEAGKKIVAQLAVPGQAAPVYSPVSDPIVVGDCTVEGASPNTSALTIGPLLNQGSSVLIKITGTPPESSANLRVCVNGLESEVDPISSGAFPAVTIKKLDAGDVVVAQVTDSSGKYLQSSNEVAVGSCTSTENGDDSSRPTLSSIPSPGGQIVTGRVQLSKGVPITKYVRVCVASIGAANTKPDYRQYVVASVDDNGVFRAALPSPTSDGDQIVAQSITSELHASPRTYGLVSDSKVSGLRYNGFFGSFIGGVEESGYSSDNINTNAFLSLYLRSGYFGMRKNGQLGHAFWGRIRLLSAPQQSAPNIVSTIANPTGQLSQSTLSSVGAVIDYSFGYEFRFRQWDAPTATTRVSFIGGIGETTPLNTANPTIFNAPGVNTQDCTNLLAQYPGVLFSGARLSKPACLENPASKTAYDYVAYTQQKRTGFLFKYGGGIRFARVGLPQSQGGPLAPFMLDATLGQDESITKGKLWGPVFRLDGQYPFPIPSLASFLYIFGSSSVRLRSSQNLPTINLATPQSGIPTIPNPAVVVLSTEQPDRDFYRIGFGLNLTTLLSNWSKGSGTQDATKPAASGTGNSTKGQ